MRRYNLILAILLGLCLYACKSNDKTTVADKNTFGETISEANVITYDQLLAKMDQAEEVQATVRGKVDAVCQAKGCWMTIVSEERPEELFVKFKDYGFFMPADISGKEVVMRGKAYKEETSVEELRHYAEDEGQSEEEINAITEPVVELKFMADGVIIKP